MYGFAPILDGRVPAHMAKDPPWQQLELRPNEIVFEVDNWQIRLEDAYTLQAYTGAEIHEVHELRAGNGSVLFNSGSFPGTEGMLRSRFIAARQDSPGARLPRDVLDMFRDPIPGVAIVLDTNQKYARLVDLLALDKPAWMRMRDRALRLDNPVIVGLPYREVRYDFRDEFGWWGWAFELRCLVDCGSESGAERRGLVREVQNSYLLPARKQCAESGRVKLTWTQDRAGRVLQADFMRDMVNRAAKLGNPALYTTDNILTPALAGFDDSADFVSCVVPPTRS